VATWIETQKASTGVSAKADNTLSFKYSDLDLTRKLSINGTTIVNTVPATLQAFADLINLQKGTTNVEAVVIPRDETILIRNTPAHTGKNIVLGNPTGTESTNFLNQANATRIGRVEYTGTNVNFEFQNHGAGQGKATDLSRIGLATTITSSTRLDDDFLLYVTGSANDVDVRYKVQAKADLPEVSIEPPFSLTFLSPTQVQITDTNTSTVMAKKNYAWPNGVLVNDVKVLFEEAPTTGDVFTIKSNQGAIGDNGNIKRILSVQEVGVDGDEIPTQRYISLISSVSNKHNLAEMSSQALKVVKDDAEALLDNTTGVTLDTEAADLIRYQQSYQAAAQVIKVSQTLFDTLLTANR
jgi:flagellar hook-associated protein FlgK